MTRKRFCKLYRAWATRVYVQEYRAAVYHAIRVIGDIGSMYPSYADVWERITDDFGDFGVGVKQKRTGGR